MVTVTFEGNSYLYSRSNDGGVWVGNGGPRGGRYPGIDCAAPVIMFPELIARAIEAGTDKAFFISEKKEVKTSKPRAFKTKKNAISIFG